MKRILGLICLTVLAGMLLAGVSSQQLKLRKGALTNRWTVPIIKSQACTTQFIGWGQQPYASLGFGLWCKPVADTWLVNVTFKWTGWPNSSGPFDWRSDTVLTQCEVDGAGDTLRTRQRHWLEEFYPRVSQGGYFIFQATESLTDTVWVDSVVFNGGGL